MRVLVASLVLTLTMGTAAAGASNAFRGAWESIDADGSYQQLTVGGGGTPVRVHLVDHGATLCNRLEAPNDVATIRGTGTVSGSTLFVMFDEIRCNGGIVFETPGGSWTFEHDAATDTLVIDLGPDENGQPIVIIWERIGSR